MFDKGFCVGYNTTRVIARCTMRLNVNKLLHTPGSRQEIHFEMDLSDLEFREKSVDYACVLAEERQSDEDDDIVLLESDEVDVTELARDAFILDMDTKFLCSEDCKGLCPGCGADLNRESCRCKKAVDPRLAKLAQLLQNDE